MMATESTLYTVDEVAARLRSNPETIRRWLRSGKLKGWRPGGDKLGWRITEEEVRRLTEGGPSAE